MDPNDPNNVDCMRAPDEMDDSVADSNYTTDRQGQPYYSHQDDPRGNHPINDLFLYQPEPWNPTNTGGPTAPSEWTAHGNIDYHHSPTSSKMAEQGSAEDSSKKSKGSKESKKKQRRPGHTEPKRRSGGHSKRDRKDDDSEKDRGHKGQKHTHGQTG